MSHVLTKPASTMRSSARPSRPFGALREAALYIERPADADLLRALQAGESAHVLAARQTGKTHLLHRAQNLLTAQGYRCVKLDMGAFCYESTVAQWYLSLARELALVLGLPAHFAQSFLGTDRGWLACERFARFLRAVLRSTAAPVVLFLDEAESLLRMPRSAAAGFLTALRSAASGGKSSPLRCRLRFCLAGAYTFAELLQCVPHTDCPTTREITLEDFDWPSVRASFLPSFVEAGLWAEAALARIYYWTQGHPYLTHRLCEEVLDRARVSHTLVPGVVDHAVQELFVNSSAREQEDISDIERRLLSGPPRRALRRLALYARLLKGCKLLARRGDSIQMELRLTGLVKRIAGEPPCLAIRNPIFAAVFGADWLHRSLTHSALHLHGRTSRFHNGAARSYQGTSVLYGEPLR